MKPTYALNLSPDGIGLLHRAPGGWHLVGEVGLDAPDLGDQLEFLRKTAAGLEPAGVTTKLIIPNSQVHYRTLDVDGDSAGEQAAAVINAMEAATPYALDELAIDWQPTRGDKVAVAAVARETLAEAEAFAADNKFNAVSFVAVPPPGSDFPTEPFFGETIGAVALLGVGERVERDDMPTVPGAPFAPVSGGNGPLILTPADGVAIAPQTLSTQPAASAPLAVDLPETTMPTRSQDQPAKVAARQAGAPAPSTHPARGSGASFTSRTGRITPGVVLGTRAPSMSPRAQIVIGTILIVFAILLIASVIMRETLSARFFRGDNPAVAVAAIDRSPNLSPATIRTAVGFEPPRPQALAALAGAPPGRTGNVLGTTTGRPERVAHLATKVAPAPDGATPVLVLLARALPEAEITFSNDELAAPVLAGAPEPGVFGTHLRPYQVASRGGAAIVFETLVAPGLSIEAGIIGPDEALPVSPGALPDATIPSAGATTVAALVLPEAEPALVTPLPGRAAMVSAIAPPVYVSDPPDTLFAWPQIRTTSVDRLVTADPAAPESGSVAPGLVDPALRAAVAEAERAEPADPALAPETPIWPLLSLNARNPVAASVAAIHPRRRQAPQSVAVEKVERALLAAVDGTDVEASLIRPRNRPGNIGSRQIASSAAANATPLPATTSGSVARRATQGSVLKLNKVNLIGLFGQASDRRALVRLPSGRIISVKIGDRLDGGQVVAIGANGLIYAKNGRNHSLSMPLG